jgi:hypothetical protein
MDDFDGGSRFDSPMMGVMGMMGMFMPILIALVAVSMMSPVIMYVIARWRQNRDQVQDPQLGIKFALGFFRQLGYTFMLLGGFVVVFGIIGKNLGGARGDIMRPAFGLLIPGLIVWGVHNLALQRTNRIQFATVERLWAGYNLLSTGLIGFIALIMIFQSLFAKGDTGNFGRMAWALGLVYISAWAVQGVFFLNRVLDSTPTSQAPPSTGTAASGGGDGPWTKPLS